MAFELHSSAFGQDQTIPRRYTCDGADLSVPLSWTGAPEKAEAFVIVADDPDAPRGNWVHWVVYDLPADTNGLPEGISHDEIVAYEAHQGRNDFGKIGYGGPCPPAGSAHRYFFKLYALDAKTGLHPGATKAEIEKAIEGHVIGETQLVGLYKRSR